MTGRKKSTGIENGTFNVSRESKTQSRTHGEPSSRALTTEIINNFSEIILAVYKTQYVECMKVLWNAVSYEHIADYCTEWLKRKHRSEYAAAPSIVTVKDITSTVDVQNDNAKPDIVCFFSLFLSGLFCSLDNFFCR